MTSRICQGLFDSYPFVFVLQVVVLVVSSIMMDEDEMKKILGVKFSLVRLLPDFVSSEFGADTIIDHTCNQIIRRINE